MRRIRVIPVILISQNGVVKTTKFRSAHYIGDPINTVRIFNDKEVDELMILDIDCAKKNIALNFSLIEKIAGECFMPVSYGGGIKTVEQAKKIIKLGIEKIVINTAAYNNPKLIHDIASEIGSQSVIVSIDYKKNIFGNQKIYTRGGQKQEKKDLVEYAKEIEKMGAGECLITDINKDGTRSGYDIQTLKKITSALNIPVIACGGASDIRDFVLAVNEGGASAVAAGSMFVYVKQKESILINYPSQEALINNFYSKVK